MTETQYPIVKKVELYSDQGGSDKSYFIFIERRGEGTEADAIYHVTTKWGPRGGILRDTPLTKNKLVTFAEAQRIFAEQWAKKASGSSRYRVPDWAVEGDTSALVSPSASSSDKVPDVPFNFSGMKFEQADPEELELYVRDGNYWFEQKADGVRGLVRLLDGRTTIHAHTGMLLKSTYAAKAFEHIHRETARIIELVERETVIDGEILEHFHLFDLPRADVAGFYTTEQTPYLERRVALEEFYDGWRPEGVRLLPVAKTEAHKRLMVEELRRRNCEGLMIKHVNGVYQPGKRVRHSLKLKFTYTLDAFVIEKNTGHKGGQKDNAVLGVYREGDVVEVARASLIGKQHAGEIKVGDVVELKYRGAVKKGVQPTILRRREDKTREECLYSQLVFMSKEIVDFEFQ